jgi:hypothetical protein
MDILSRILKPIRATPGQRTVDDQGTSWPRIPAVHGKYYGTTDHHGAHIVSMTKETWEELGTIIEQQRRTMRAQDSAIKQQSDEIRRLQGLYADATTRLETLRSNHRVLLKERVEGGMNLPTEHATTAGLPIFHTPKKD